MDNFSWTTRCSTRAVATGSPFQPTSYAGRLIKVGQCNNVFIFPGVGLGVIASGADRVTDAMFSTAARVLSEFSPALADAGAPLYPALENVREISRKVAVAVGVEAHQAGLAKTTSLDELERNVRDKMWRPQYVRLRRTAL